jgi:RimJ/RimL family protein N-acetyltransferase
MLVWAKRLEKFGRWAGCGLGSAGHAWRAERLAGLALAGTARTERVRAERLGDCRRAWLLREIAGDPGEQSGLNVEQVSRWMTDRRGGWRLGFGDRSVMVPLVLSFAASAEPFGVMLLRSTEKQPDVVELSVWCASVFRGRGLMREAVCAVCDGIDSSGRCEFVMRCVPSNVALARLAARCGFTPSGTMMNDRMDSSGRLLDTVIFTRGGDADSAVAHCGTLAGIRE